MSPVCASVENCPNCNDRHTCTGHAYEAYAEKGTLLSVEGVGLQFDGRDILKNVNIAVHDVQRTGKTTGEIVALLGPSGVGKTVLLRILAGLQKPTSGQVFLGTERRPVHAGLVGMVSQQYIVYRHRSVLGNLKVAAMNGDRLSALERWKKYFKRLQEAKRRSLEVLDRFDLREKVHLYPSQLSGGQRQRVAIAQQLLCSDHFLLMDEPTAGLDPLSKKRVCKLVDEVANHEQGVTIIMSTHDIPTAVALANTIWLLGRDRDEHGNIIPGARVVDTYDLIKMGLAWNPNVRRHPAFVPLVEELQERFETL